MVNPQLHLNFVYEKKGNRFVASVSTDLFNEWDAKADEHARIRFPAEITNNLERPRILRYQGDPNNETWVVAHFLPDLEEPPIQDFYAIWW